MASASHKKSGRPGSTLKSRELTALIGALDQGGDGISVDTLSARLGITAEEVKRRLHLILTAGGNESGLPLLESDDGARLALANGSGNRGRRVRLTKEETVAVQAALNYVGLPENDPLRTTIDQALSSTPVDNGIVLRALGGMRGHTAEADSLSACARAIADFGLLEFSYQGVSESASRERRVDPKALRVSGDHWILDGIDMDKRAMRHFRVDHMSDILQIPAEEEDEAAMVEDAPLRQVRVTFHNKSYLSIFDWPGARLISDGDDGTTIELPYFGGMWLPRRLAACGGTLTIYDEELKRRTTAYAQALLNQLGQKAPAQA